MVEEESWYVHVYTECTYIHLLIALEYIIIILFLNRMCSWSGSIHVATDHSLASNVLGPLGVTN